MGMDISPRKIRSGEIDIGIRIQFGGGHFSNRADIVDARNILCGKAILKTECFGIVQSIKRLFCRFPLETLHFAPCENMPEEIAGFQHMVTQDIFRNLSPMAGCS